MDFRIVAVMLFFYGAAVIEVKASLRTGSGDIIAVPEDNSEGKPSKVLALVIVEDIDESEDTDPSTTHEVPMLPFIENPQIMLPWIESVQPKDYDEDTSGESNSDEYPDSDTELDSDSESSYYHEDDYLKDKIMDELQLMDYEHNSFKALRSRWKSCQKKASKYCRQACVASYKNACTEHKCKKKLKKSFKKECKQNCKDMFTD